MVRQQNTNKNGDAWTEAEIEAVWQKGNIIPGYDADSVRYDKCSNIMLFSLHGKRNSEYGWEIDHINPVANGGGDDISNLQPLNWTTNVAKGDNLNWICKSIESPLFEKRLSVT